MDLDVSDIVNYGTIAIWIFSIAAFIAAQVERLKKGEPMNPLGYTDCSHQM